MKKIVIILIGMMMLVMLTGMGGKTGGDEEEGIKPVSNTVQEGLQPVSEPVVQGMVSVKTKQVENTGNTIKAKETKGRIKRMVIEEAENGRSIFKVYNVKGDCKEEIKLRETVKKKIKAKDRSGKLRSGTQEEYILGTISEDGKKAAIIKYRGYLLEGLYREEQPDSILEMELRDENGEVRWSKEIGKNRGVGMQKDIKVLDNGLVIIRDASDSENGAGTATLHVYNEKGEEIFTFPGQTGIQGEPDDFSISPNGKYLGINYSTRKPPYKHSVIFFNLSNGRSWDIGEKWGIGRIENDGKAELFYRLKQKFIDLKTKLGE